MATAPLLPEAIMKAPILLASLVLLAVGCASPTAPSPAPGSHPDPLPGRDSHATGLRSPVIGGTPAARPRNPVIGGTP